MKWQCSSQDSYVEEGYVTVRINFSWKSNVTREYCLPWNFEFALENSATFFSFRISILLYVQLYGVVQSEIHGEYTYRFLWSILCNGLLLFLFCFVCFLLCVEHFFGFYFLFLTTKFFVDKILYLHCVRIHTNHLYW